MLTVSATRLRALGLLWTLVAVSFGVTVPLVGGVAYLAGTDTAGFFGVATVGVRNVSLPLLEQAARRGIDPAVGYMLVNGTVLALLWGLVLATRRGDPALAPPDAPPPRRDPTLALFLPIPSFRRIRDEALRPLFVRLVAIPCVVPVVLGMVFAAVVLRTTDPERLLASTSVTAAALLPHAFVELTAVFIPLAVLHAIYLGRRDDLEAGRGERVWAAIRSETALPSVTRPMILSAGLIVAAGLLEAHVSIPLAEKAVAWWSA